MSNPTGSNSRERENRSPSHTRPSPTKAPSRTPSPTRGGGAPYAHPQRYNLAPLRSINSSGPGGPSSLNVPREQLPRLVLQTQTDSHSRAAGGAYSTLRSAGAGSGGSGSTSPADYVGGGVARGVGHGHLSEDLQRPETRDRGRRYSGSGGSDSGRSISRSASETSLPMAPPEKEQPQPSRRVDGYPSMDQTHGPGRDYGNGDYSYGNGHVHGHRHDHHYQQAPDRGWREDEADRLASAGVTPGPVLPPIPRTTKVVPPRAQTPPPPSRQKPKNVGTGGSVNYSTAKSRKSSCGLCHHRKIRCDQARPSCGSCARKGHTCVYADDSDRSMTGQIITPTNRSITIMSANNPSEKRVVTVPHTSGSKPSPAPQRPPPPVHTTSSNSRGGPGPEWMGVRSGLPTPTSGAYRSGDPNPMSPTHGMRNGPGNDNDNISGTGNISVHINEFENFLPPSRAGRSGENRGGGEIRAGEGMGAQHLADLAAAAAASGGHVKVKLEVEEPESDAEQPDGRGRSRALSNAPSGISQAGSAHAKRGVNGEDEMTVESGPPKKRRKSRQSAPTFATTNAPLRVPDNPHRPHSGSSTSGSNSRRSAGHSPYPYSPRPHDQTDLYSSSLNSLLSSLPSHDIQRILFDTFFADHYLNEGITLLQPQFMEDLQSLLQRSAHTQTCHEGDATTLANAFAILATALRIMPDETSRLLLASSVHGMQGQLQPKSLSRVLNPSLHSHPDPTPLDQRYYDLAVLCSQIAESGDSPSVMLVMLKLILFRNLAIRGDKQVIAGQYLGGAIKVAQALGMGKEWEGIPQGERELRRRVMWCLYIADRHLSFETAFPYTILDAHQGIHLPSPISETNLYKIAQDAQSLPPHSTETGPTPCTGLFIHTHLARRITPILDSFATISPSHTPHDLVLRFDQSLDHFQDALPPYMRLFPGTDGKFDSSHTYLAAHRTRLHARILAYRQGVHRSFIITYLRPSAPSGIRGVMAGICLSSLRTQRSAKMLDPKLASRIFDPTVVFESAMVLGMILFVENAMGNGGSAETTLWRDGLAGGVELLDNASSSGEVARKGVGVLREICKKVDMANPDIKPFAFDPLTSGNDTSTPPPDEKPVPAKNSRRVEAIDAWLDGMAKDRRSLEVLLREPHWEGGWDFVFGAM